MQDPTALYEIDPTGDALALGVAQSTRETPSGVPDEVLPATRPARGAGPVMLHVLDGFVDAGRAGSGLVAHLLETYEPTRVATFDVDQLLDYRSRRPRVTYDASAWRDLDTPRLVVDLLRDDAGTPFLLMHGLEPDLQWERFVAAVRQVVERYDVPLVVGTHGIPMGIPHTRPASVSVHGTRPELVADHPAWLGSVEVPASASTLLEVRLGEEGHDALGFAVHVPHYLAGSTYPRASVVALEKVARAGGLELVVDGLEASARLVEEDIARQVADNDEVAQVVEALERQYDAFTGAGGRGSLLADSADLPSAEELGAQFEEFLATFDAPGEPTADGV